jgi:hypothetical protein
VQGDAFDYLEHRQGDHGETIEAFGTKCGRALDLAACTAAVNAITATSPFPRGGCGGYAASLDYYVYTRGDQVGRITSGPELIAAFGTIDTPSKAFLAATGAGFSPICESSSEVRAMPEGFELTAFKFSETARQYIVYVVRVRSDGTVEIVKDTGPTSACNSVGRRPAGVARARARAGVALMRLPLWERIARRSRASRPRPSTPSKPYVASLPRTARRNACSVGRRRPRTTRCATRR